MSNHFGDIPAALFYNTNIFIIAIFQNAIWDYACRQKEFVDDERLDAEQELRKRINLMVNLDMVNSIVAIIVAFFMPRTSFFLQFFKVPVFIVATIYIARQRRLDMKKRKNSN